MPTKYVRRRRRVEEPEVIVIPPAVPEVPVPREDEPEPVELVIVPAPPEAPAVRVERLPAGTIVTTEPWSNRAFGFPWSRLQPNLDLFNRMAAKYRIDPRLTLAMSIVESNHQHTRNGRIVTNDDRGPDGLAYGIMQVKLHLWGDFVPGVDGMTLEGNVELGTALMARFIEREGSWQQAIAKHYHPGTSLAGTTPQDYIDTVTSLLAEMAGSPILDPWRAYPYPPMRKDAHVRKPAEGAGFTRCQPRRAHITGFCTHITDGDPGGDEVLWYRDFFATGGERAWDALTDLVIARNGDIGLLNDWRDPDWGGRRAPWANGGVDGLEGDGVTFYRYYPDINFHLVSCEHVDRAGQPWTDAMIASTIEVRTALFQELQVPWDTYPHHPGFHGVSVEQTHHGFATKSCPATPYLWEVDQLVKAEVKEKLRIHQGGLTTPQPEPDDTLTAYGFTVEQLSWFFGTMTRVNDDGSVDALPFSPAGPLSLMWMERAEREGIFPEAAGMASWDSQLAPGREWFATWQGGWTAFLAIDNQRAGWQWLGVAQEKAA